MYSDVSLPSASVAWLTARSDLRESTKSAYKGEIGRLTEFLATHGVLNVRDVSEDLWLAYLKNLATGRHGVQTKKRNQLTPQSVKQAERITRSFLMWLLSMGSIDWLPQLPTDDQPPLEKREGKLASTPLSGSLAAVLLGAGKQDSEGLCRAYLVANLLFWCALKPSELAAAKVGDLGLHAAIDGISLRVPNRTQAALGPKHIWDLWERYCDARTIASGKRPNSRSPLVASLRHSAPLTPWSIWSALHRDFDGLLTAQECTPRFLRSQYLTLSMQDALENAREVSEQTGISMANFPLAQHPKNEISIARRLANTHTLVYQALG
jgi:site-specific recombinase XerD